MRFILILALATTGACTAFPDLDARVDAATRNAAYPTLQSLGPLIAHASDLETNGQITPASVAAFNSRIANLRSKAARLRAPIIDTATQTRMRRGVAVPVAIR
ncbi:MAG: hypothetical protein ACI82I_001892 [Gammaproteobacteria bacterium]|jgi:hypothetical protein